jgi:hypothetical protein
MRKRGGVTINMEENLLKEEETKKVQTTILVEGDLLIIRLI